MHESSGSLPDSESQMLEDAFQAIDRYTAMQNGEPQLITFGEPIKRYAWLNTSKPGAMLPSRKPILIDHYEGFEQLTESLTAQAKTDFSLDPQKQALLETLTAIEDNRARNQLPLTTAEEVELEAFELNCLDLDSIREAARRRAEKPAPKDPPRLTLLNTETAESRTVALNAAALIADGSLRLERQRINRDGDHVNSATITTSILLGKFLTGIAAELGLEANDVAIEEKKRRKTVIHSARSIFDSQPRISNDFWTENGDYSPAAEKPHRLERPPRHSLSNGLNYRRVDSYSADNFLEASQAAIDSRAHWLHNFTGDTLALRPLTPFNTAFNGLRQAIAGYKRGVLELGYYVGADRVTGQILCRDFMLVIGEHADSFKRLTTLNNDEPRIGLESAAREFERLRSPAILRAIRSLRQS
ncbi:MAG TPA: hypothetical protein VHC21_03000 [Candidatus Saccharimonadales bacterium]|nr:hypothetical protein [Candidatus Saccharimonadales bacterium]